MVHLLRYLQGKHRNNCTKMLILRDDEVNRQAKPSTHHCKQYKQFSRLDNPRANYQYLFNQLGSHRHLTRLQNNNACQIERRNGTSSPNANQTAKIAGKQAGKRAGKLANCPAGKQHRPPSHITSQQAIFTPTYEQEPQPPKRYPCHQRYVVRQPINPPIHQNTHPLVQLAGMAEPLNSQATGLLPKAADH